MWYAALIKVVAASDLWEERWEVAGNRKIPRGGFPRQALKLTRRESVLKKKKKKEWERGGELEETEKKRITAIFEEHQRRRDLKVRKRFPGGTGRMIRGIARKNLPQRVENFLLVDSPLPKG